ncbi:unnamed protein product [Phytophthora fragariaefolia]|uniref:Unnamed protein product n=1 Tax=Phytophthora fragariaefolia TaxID=1490495 RepID=A0A9W6UCR0_9STRA|nr:unnamed protein product [Phytophthora fragariaefolia]
MQDSGSRLPTRQDFPHLTATVERFDKYESSLIAHVSAAAQEAARATMRAEAQSAAQASATNTTSFAALPTTTKPVKMSVPTFDGKDSDSLVFWVSEIEIALSADQIYDALVQVAFALSNLGGRARAWARARETATPGFFTSWSFMEQRLRSTFLFANVAYRHRSNFLRCKQGKRSLQDYVVELHNLEAAMAGAPLSEDVMVTIFMDGVRMGPVRTELFRRQSKTFNEAVHIAMLGDHCVRSAQGHTPQVEASEGPTPMEISLVESAHAQQTQRAGGRCFGFPGKTSVYLRTKASVAKINALYASALEPFIVLDMEVRYDLILGMPWLAKHESWIDWRSRTIGASHNPLADSALVGHVPASSRDGFVHENRVPRRERQFTGSSEVLELPTASPPRAREPEVGDGENPQNPNTSPMGRQGSAVCNRVALVQGTVTTQGADAAAARAGTGGSFRAHPTQSVVAGSAHVEECAGVVARANKSGRVGAPTTEGAGACVRATTCGRARAPTSKAIRGDKVTNMPKAAASSHDADSAAVDKVPHVIDVFTGEPKVEEALTPLPTVVELPELEELSCVEFLDSLKAGELEEVVLLRPEGSALELNSSSAMDSEVLEDERTSMREISHLYPHQPPAWWIDVGTSDLVVNPILAMLHLLFQGFLSEPKISLGQGIAPSLHYGGYRNGIY